MTNSIELAAHYNADSNTVKVQMYVVSDCDTLLHSQDVLSGNIQLYNVYNTPKTGYQEIPLESINFNKNQANVEGFFTLFFINPSISTNLEARATVTLESIGPVTGLVTVLNEAGTLSDSPNTSVIGNAINPSWHLDKQAERDEYRLEENPHNIPALVEEQLVIPDPEIVNPLYEDIQFEQLAELKSANRLSGTLTYIGGGNRLLPKPGVLVFQDADVPGWEIGTSTFVEQEATELLPNNQFLTPSNSGYPDKYGLVDSPGIAVISNNLQTLQAEGFQAKAWVIKLNGAVPTSISPFNLAKLGIVGYIPFDASKPIALSFLAGMEKNTGNTSISSAKIVFTFYDYADRELTSMVRALDVDSLFNARPLKPFSFYAHLSDYPPTAEKIRWRFEIGSMEQGDFVTVRLALPSMTQTPFATSQVLSGNTRLKDNLSYALSSVLPAKEGAVIISLATGFQGPPTEEKYIFDTRATPGLLSGVALKVEATGHITLVIADDTSSISLTSATVPNWQSGVITEIVAEWSNSSSLRRITVDGTVVAQDTATALPANITDIDIESIQLGSDSNITKHVDSEFIRVVILKRPRN